MLIEYAQIKDAILLINADKIKPNFRPFISIILDAIGAPKAVPTIIKAVGNVAKYLILMSCDPIIPLNKTVTVGDVKENTCPIDRIIKFLLSIRSMYIVLSI